MNVGLEKINVYSDGGDSPHEGRVVIEPLTRGYGHTIGNPLRRILLSSIPGASAIGIKIPGVSHEFMIIPGTTTDVTEFILNLKKVRFSCHVEGLHTVTFAGNKVGSVYAKDLVLPDQVGVTNPDQHLFNLNGDQPVEMQIFVRNGRGYLDASMHTEFEEDGDVITVDGMFSPVTKVGYAVENMRIGQDTSYERLVLDIETDGSITPKDAALLASKIAHSHFSFFENMSELVDKVEIHQEKQEEEENRILDLPISHLDFSVRSSNCLKREGYKVVRDIVNLTEADIGRIHQLGEKSVNEIIAKIKELGLEFRKN